jgi:Uma2 family endonuclease
LIVEFLRDLNESARRAGVHVRVRQPVQIPRFNVPEPDASIVSGSKYDYADRNPSAADVLSVVEVADSSLDFDRTTKRSIYATAGIPQYVIVNLVDSRIEVMTGPQPDGTYSRTELIEKGGTVRLNLGDDRSLEVNASQLLP